jgi:hypothetical protein
MSDLIQGVKLFDYNTSFSVMRTNPKLTGNLRITVDSTGKVSFNSMSVNQTLSSDRFKNFNITGDNTFANDVFNFFDTGKLQNQTIFQVGQFTRGSRESAKVYSDQYDFFYAAGASTLIDKNYGESFSYFAPLWIRSEIPDYFVIFKVPGPISYPYSKNQTVIESGVKYKVIQSYESSDPFIITYGRDPSGNEIKYSGGNIFVGSNDYTSYNIVSGSGYVVIFNELEYINESNDIETLFRKKILTNANVVKTFDIGENTKIGKYIRSIYNDKNFSNTPIDVNFGPGAYTYYNGVSIADGILSRKGEILYNYFTSDITDKMIDFESYMTDGFSRNGVICPNLLNLEFLFDDEDSDVYTINRYMGFYVSRNDIATLRLNGDFFYKYQDLEGNNDLPKPSRNQYGYYYDMESYGVTADTGVRLFYEANNDTSYYLPGSNDVNIGYNDKLWYLTDKHNNFYTLKRDEDYGITGGNSPAYTYGPYDPARDSFSPTGGYGYSSGTVVLQDTKVDLLDFTGISDKIATIPGQHADHAGRAYIDIEFLKKPDPTKTLTFKIYWPNGTHKEGNKRYDIVSDGDFSSLLPWIAGSYYSSGSTHYFNSQGGTLEDVATSFANVLKNVDYTTWDTGSNLSSTIIRLRDSGIYGNVNYSISIFDNYSDFVARFKGLWNPGNSYSVNDIVIYNGQYYFCEFVNTNYPDQSGWNGYIPFNQHGCILINGIDANIPLGPVNFTGGTKSFNSRIVFPSKYDSFIKEGYFINTDLGYVKVGSITRYVDDPKKDPLSEKIIGFNDFTYYKVANLENEEAVVNLGSDKSFNSYSNAVLNFGVFTFFDVKEFDFDFWSSDYGYTPTGETYKYYQIQAGVSGSIEPGVPYIVKQGQVKYGPNGDIHPTSDGVNDIFYGVTGYTQFIDVTPDLFRELVVFPAQYSNLNYDSVHNGSSSFNTTPVAYNKDLDSFNGYIGIQDISPDTLPSNATKLSVFNRGKLNNEYGYLKENYNTDSSNLSRIVPFINKWGYRDGTDARGNQYRLNLSPAFSPTNFSPSFDKTTPDSRYLTHEWFLLEQPPRKFPVTDMQNQNSYLSGPIDLDGRVRSALPEDKLYLSSYFTVEPDDYDLEFRDPKSYTKELFTSFSYNKSTGYYETLFRGAKVVIKKRSNLSNSVASNGDKYVPQYRGYEDYKFAAIIRPVLEDNLKIQDPVSYEVIENQQQKFILFVANVVMNDYKSFEVGSTGSTGASGGYPILDYTLLYSLRNKEKLNDDLSGYEGPMYSTADIKLSSALDLSIPSGSYADTSGPGRINIFPSSTYDTDLREEINVYYLQNTPGASGGPSQVGTGSFFVNGFSGTTTYPWPTGVGQDYLSVGTLSTGPTPYTFQIPFSTDPVNTVPIGPQSIYKNKPVFQIGGGKEYYTSIIGRISFSSIAARVNSSSKYIKYSTYTLDDTDPTNPLTVYSSNSFELNMARPTKLIKPSGSITTKFFGGPPSLGELTPTAYTIQSGQKLPSTLLRYSGGYEPLFRKVIHFDRDKNDNISDSIDLSFRNCNFAPSKYYFGISRNLEFTKVSLGNNILSLSQNLPEGPVYPLVGQSPIWRKDFNLFSSSWDPGYYEKFTAPQTYEYVAGTRSMKENKNFLGSKIMKTPDPVNFPNYITLEINRISGNPDVYSINTQIDSYIKSIQNIDPSNSGTGIGSVGPYLSGVDYDKIDLSVFDDAELVWQYFPATNKISGIIRMDRMLRRYLLNSGIKQVFIDNIISDFGVGSPDSVNDDVNEYIDSNVTPLYQGNVFDMFVRKTATNSGQNLDPKYMVRGDITSSDKYKMEYFPETNYKLTKVNNLIYSFEYTLESNYVYSILFNLTIGKI